MEEEDERREAVMAATPCLSPNFDPPPGITPLQLRKFQELHRRRMQLKSKLKKNKKKKPNVLFDGKEKNQGEELDAGDGLEECTKRDLSVTGSKNNGTELESSLQRDEVHPALKKKKLYWGLDTKERWERKANM